MTRAPAAVEWVVQQAADSGLIEPEMENLPDDVANALRSMIAGERPAPTLPPHAIAQLGEVIARLDTSRIASHGRSTLGPDISPLTAWVTEQSSHTAPKAPRKVSEGLVEQAGLSPDKAARVEAVVHWPIGFTREDLAHWGQLSEVELEAVWDYIGREHGFYPTGTRYAAP